MKRRDKKKGKTSRPGYKCRCGHWAGHYASDHGGPDGEGPCSKSIPYESRDPKMRIKATCDCKKARRRKP